VLCGVAAHLVVSPTGSGDSRTLGHTSVIVRSARVRSSLAGLDPVSKDVWVRAALGEPSKAD
jgi:hypothetical protein